MAIVGSLESKGARAWVSDAGFMKADFDQISEVRAGGAGGLGFLTFYTAHQSACDVVLPYAVAQAMKDAFDKAMSELSKEDAA